MSETPYNSSQPDTSTYQTPSTSANNTTASAHSADTVQGGISPYLIAALIAFAVVILFIIGSAVAFMLFFMNSNSMRFDSTSIDTKSSLTAEGTASRKVKPDTAIANFMYQQKGVDITKMNQDADAKINTVTDYLKTNGIDSSKIVSNKNSYPNFTYRPDGTYDESETIVDVSFEITFENIEADMAQPNKVLKGLVDLGITQFSGFRYSIADSEKVCQELETEAIQKAYDLAVGRIEALGGGDVVKTEIQPYSSGCGQGFGYPIMSSEANMGTKSDSMQVPELSAGEQELQATASVKVIYE